MCLVLTLATTQKWHIKQINYILASTQAVAEVDMYILSGFTFLDSSKKASKDYVLQIKKNYYVQKPGAQIWNQYLVKNLLEALFLQSAHDKCLFYHRSSMYVLYMDDSILTGPNKKELDNIISKMEQTGLKMTYEDGLDDFLGVNVDHKEDGSIHLTQPHLIRSILDDVHLNAPNIMHKATPATVPLHILESPIQSSFSLPISHREIELCQAKHQSRLFICHTAVCMILYYS